MGVPTDIFGDENSLYNSTIMSLCTFKELGGLTLSEALTCADQGLLNSRMNGNQTPAKHWGNILVTTSIEKQKK